MKNSYYENERILEWDFEQERPFFHLYTNPLKTDILFHQDEERKMAMNRIAISSVKSGVEILAFVLMSNHLHFILRGKTDCCRFFYENLERSFSSYYSHHGYPRIMDPVKAGLTEITSLRQLRDEIVYVLRNPFVARDDVNPLSYRWGSGPLYFSEQISASDGEEASSLSGRVKRELTKSRDRNIPDRLRVFDGVILPSSYVDYKKVEQYFQSTRRFLMHLFKGVEAQVETALRYGENPMLNDDEALSVTMKLSKKMFLGRTPKQLEAKEKEELARMMKYDYQMSNAQISRMSGVAPEVVEVLFPLSVK